MKAATPSQQASIAHDVRQQRTLDFGIDFPARRRLVDGPGTGV